MQIATQPNKQILIVEDETSRYPQGAAYKIAPE
jgi:hypothetical protein